MADKKTFREDRFTWKKGDLEIFSSEAAMRKAGHKIVGPLPVKKRTTKAKKK